MEDDTSRALENNKRGYLEDKINELETDSKMASHNILNREKNYFCN
jgi:hypothetical protein